MPPEAVRLRSTKEATVALRKKINSVTESGLLQGSSKRVETVKSSDVFDWDVEQALQSREDGE